MEKLQCPGYYLEYGKIQPAFPDDKVDVLVQELDGQLKIACPYLRDIHPNSPLLCGKIPSLNKDEQVAAGCPYAQK
ncbi:hypothetical protein KJ632_04700 [Patescibacteria group bacterium]|nr:hypothetical protein [Patescibacteria group bacterium]